MTVSERECRAMRLLARDGWTVGELRMTMHLCHTQSVRHHVIGECQHSERVRPLDEWDGQQPPAGTTDYPAPAEMTVVAGGSD
ncbi:hypothetical protein NDI85_19735 [Halomicroarcula sp. S1AR25-4]|uniref:hypothetical protein n=1 Tax=Haloarcula sp. S1AR25-4 TaxID=2950538 RepID=UPI0028756588|nr:hypothetical protein [Halomicroarcula sp. S1AR25-4]MDS0280020.1 hypothetical protein [Halomicroarcula sp. S1AR25-4]